MNNSADSVKAEGVPSSGRPFFSDSVCTAILLIAVAPRWRGAYSRRHAVGLLIVIVVASLPAITMFKQAKVRKRLLSSVADFVNRVETRTGCRAIATGVRHGV